MTDFIRAWLGRIIATAVAFVAAWLLNKTGVAIDDETQTKAVEVIVAVMLAVYAVVHKLADRWLNPGDAAAPVMVSQEKTEATVAQQRLSRS